MLKDFLPPHIYKVDSRQVYFDPVRKKYVPATERETVRQRVVPYLMRELDVPRKMIRIGEKLSDYGLNEARRADVVVEYFDRAENVLRPIAVVECKASENPLDEPALNEAFDYAEKLGCDYCLLTNGDRSLSFYLGAEEIVALDSLPPYREMIRARRRIANQSE